MNIFSIRQVACGVSFSIVHGAAASSATPGSVTGAIPATAPPAGASHDGGASGAKPTLSSTAAGGGVAAKGGKHADVASSAPSGPEDAVFVVEPAQTTLPPCGSIYVCITFCPTEAKVRL